MKNCDIHSNLSFIMRNIANSFEKSFFEVNEIFGGEKITKLNLISIKRQWYKKYIRIRIKIAIKENENSFSLCQADYTGM